MAQGGQSQGGLSDLSSVFTGDKELKINTGVNYIEDVHATGFTINVQGTDFLGIEGSTYENPGGMWQGIDPDQQMVNTITDIHSTGFVSYLQEGDDTLFSGIVGNVFTNPGDLGFGGILDSSPIDVINNDFAVGFTPSLEHLSPSLFIGIDGDEYTNPGTLGSILINYQQDLNAPQTQWVTEGSLLGVTSEDVVDTIENIHANGFTWLGPIEEGNIYTTQFNAINGLEFNISPEQGGTIFYEGIEPEFQSVHAPELHFSPGFVPGLTEEDDTLFSGVVGEEFTNLGELWEMSWVDGYHKFDTGINVIPNIHANGFTLNLQPLQEQLVGISVETQDAGPQYQNQGNMWESEYGHIYGGVNWIDTDVMTGFTRNRAPGTGELYNSISEFQGTSIAHYENPGIGLGMHYYTEYDDDGTIDHLIPAGVYNLYMTGFTKNRKHLMDSEFTNITGLPEDLQYTNPGILWTSEWINFSAQITDGVDFINTSGLTGDGGPHATGFTPYIQDEIDGGILSEYHIVDGIANGAGTIYDEIYPGSGDDATFNNYYTDGEGIEIGDGAGYNNIPALIENNAGRTLTIAGNPVTELTLGDIYTNHIDNLIDWEKVQSKTAVGSSYEPFVGNGGFLPLTFDRGTEPYITRPIPSHSDNGNGRDNIVSAHLEDAVRLAKYAISADGVKFMGIQMVSGLGAYMVHRDIKHGSAVNMTEPGKKANQRKYDDIEAGLVGGHQQFQYFYNPLSLFSSNIPFVKVRVTRSWVLDESKYTERKRDGFMGALDVFKNKNAKLNMDVFKQIDPSFGKPFNNQKKNSEEISTLGGDLVNNVNESIDGTPVNVEGIVGDQMTLAPIDKDDIPAISKPADKNIHSVKHGYPFYFKDLRNEKILAFRGYIEDINENVNANWAESTFIGRSEPVYTYQSSTRDLNFTMKLYAMNPIELDRIYAKLDYLTNLCYPQYFKDDNIGYTRPKPPLTRLRLADLYGGQPGGNESAEYINGVLGFIQSINYSFSGPWESVMGDNYKVPRYITANISYKILNDKVPGMDADGNNKGLVPHYGYKYYSDNSDRQ
tara:strand:+ start:1946 stop:5119 length:3174 start_codon:yes stop_codon:yes gene_type:complete